MIMNMDEKLAAETEEDRDTRTFLMDVKIIVIELIISAGHWEQERPELFVGQGNKTWRTNASGCKKSLTGLSREDKIKKKKIKRELISEYVQRGLKEKKAQTAENRNETEA
jgi:hypothetical protein